MESQQERRKNLDERNLSPPRYRHAFSRSRSELLTTAICCQVEILCAKMCSWADGYRCACRKNLRKAHEVSDRRNRKIRDRAISNVRARWSCTGVKQSCTCHRTSLALEFLKRTYDRPERSRDRVLRIALFRHEPAIVV